MEYCCGAVVACEFVVAGGEAAPLLDVAESAFDDVAASVVGSVERGWSTASGSAPLAVSDLIAGLGNYRCDAAGTQVTADRAGRICLVCPDPIWSGSRSSPACPIYSQLVHQGQEHW